MYQGRIKTVLKDKNVSEIEDEEIDSCSIFVTDNGTIID